MKRFATLLFGVAAAATAQSPTLPHVVLTELTGGNPAAQLVEVDPVSGGVTVLPRFASDTMPPLAVASDAIDGATLVALDQGGGQCRIVRLDRVGPAFTEHHVATLSGRVAELLIADGDLVVAVDAQSGGLYRVPRRGGSATLVLQQGNLTAMQGYAAGVQTIELAWTGRAGTPVPDSGTGLFDLSSGQFVIGPNSFPNPNAVEVTGVIDLPTALIRQFLSFSDGTFATFVGMSGPTPTPVPTTLPIPPGGAVAMHPSSPFSIAALALGGSSYPFLYEVDAFSGAVVVRSVALPGAPVDFSPGIALTAHTEFFGSECGAIPLSQTWNGLPQLGGTFLVGVSGPANTPVFLAGGLTDFLGGVLPAPLPGGCVLDVSPDAVLFAQLGANGHASHAVNLPASSAFAGTVLFFQWVHFAAAGLSTSRAAAHWIGF